MTIARIGVAGAGTMGAGIAQLACLGGYATALTDPDSEALAAGAERLRADLGRGAARGRWSEADADAAAARLETVAELDGLADCDLVVEAAPEDLALKRELFAGLEAACGALALLATNTSSLPVGRIGAQLDLPGRLCGMHFFNPPALMRLVEVIAAERTDAAAADAVVAVAERMGRTPVRCADSPGFVVNRCNRPFTLESLRILDEGIAGHAEIDAIVREDGGYPMGPFELMDLVGIDVNLEVARSFFRQRPEPRWQPHPIQERLVTEGRLGRKAGRGFYDYGERPAAAPLEPAAASRDCEVRRAVLERIVAALVNEACFAVEEGVASKADVDLAMRLGLNHPRGPFEWARALGPIRLETILDQLQRETGDDRYRVAPLLGRMAACAPSG